MHDFKKPVICFQTANGWPHGDEGSGLRDACRGRPLARAGAGRQGSRGSQGPGPPARADPRVASGPLARAVHGAAPGPRASRLSSSSHEPRLPPPGPPRTPASAATLRAREHSPSLSGVPSRSEPPSTAESERQPSGQSAARGAAGPPGDRTCQGGLPQGRALRGCAGCTQEPSARGRRSGRSPALGTLTTLRCRLTSQRGNGRRPSCPGRSAEPTGADGLPGPARAQPALSSANFSLCDASRIPCVAKQGKCEGRLLTAS